MEYHYPVMLKEVEEFVWKQIEAKKLETHNTDAVITMFDWTLWHAGHLIALMKKFDGLLGEYIATDEDEKMYGIAKARIEEQLSEEQQKRIRLYRRTYSDFDTIAQELWRKYDIVFLDLGVNLWHFKEPERGFSIKAEGLLDMRYNQEAKNAKEAEKVVALTAADVVNTYSEEQLIDVFVWNSEISLGTSKKLAAEIVRMRKNKLFETSGELNNLTKKLWYSARVAAITFQAIRIEVNHEFQNIKEVMEKSWSCMNPGGILMILSYHSGEDRIVKEYMKRLKDENKWDILTKHAIPPKYSEVSKNRPSRSAKLRVFQFR